MIDQRFFRVLAVPTATSSDEHRTVQLLWFVADRLGGIGQPLGALLVDHDSWIRLRPILDSSSIITVADLARFRSESGLAAVRSGQSG